MIKKLLMLAAILTIASCSSKIKQEEEIIPEVTIEDKSGVQNNTQEITQEQAEALDAQTQKNIEEVEVQDRVLFDYDSSQLNEAAQTVLKTQSEWLKSDNSIKITIEGHCDERGTREYNLALGEKRANAAKNFLVSNGIDASRIKVISYGKERPAFVGAGEEAMAKNRRAVTVVQ